MRNPPPLALAAAAIGAQQCLPRRDSSRNSRALAQFVGFAALAVSVASVATFRRAKTTVDPRVGAMARTLITDGVNGVTRNPMYLGMTGTLLANAIRRRSWSDLAPVGVFVVWIDRVQIPMEERHLQDVFASDYAEYCAVVPRWVGWPSRR